MHVCVEVYAFIYIECMFEHILSISMVNMCLDVVVYRKERASMHAWIWNVCLNSGGEVIEIIYNEYVFENVEKVARFEETREVLGRIRQSRE